jgi:hypothetical protein
MKRGLVKPLAYPVCAGKGSLNAAHATRQKRSGFHQAVQTLRQSFTRAPVARFVVFKVSVRDSFFVPAGTVI